MITPGYSLTATERVLPRMALDFTTGILDARVTITRALNTATRVNSSGYVEVINANLPRFDYDGATLAPKGLLIEESRQNILFPSEDFTGWTKLSTNVTADQTLSPANVVNADLVVASSGAATTHRIDKNISLTSGVAYTFSVYAKYAGLQYLILRTANDTVQCVFDLLTGSVSNPSIGQSVNAGNGWFRFSVTGTATTTSSSPSRINISNTNTISPFVGDDVSGAFLYGAQVEAGAFATSYIPTTTSSLTRNADSVSMTGTNFSDWYDQTQGTFVAKANGYFVDASTRSILTAYASGTPANNIRILNTTSRQFQVNNSGNQVDLDGGTPASNVVSKVAAAYKVNDFALSLNGGTIVTDTSGTIPTVNLLAIGAGEFDNVRINGHILSLFYYNIRLLDRELQAFSV